MRSAAVPTRMSSSLSTLNNDIADLYVAHRGWLQLWMRRRLGCSHSAADLVHDTFLRLLGRDEPLVLLEPRAFLTTVAQRVLSNHRRREQIERAYLDALAQMPESFAPSVETRAIVLETLYEIDKLLDGLPVPVKRAFLMAQLEGATQADIAAALDISIATVKRHLTRAGAQCFFSMPLTDLPG